MVNAPFADFTWRHARDLTAARGQDPADETAIAQALDDRLNRAGDPADPKAESTKTKRIRARTRAAAVTPLRPTIAPAHVEADPDDAEPDSEPDSGADDSVVRFEIFDAAEEAKRW